MCSSHLLCISSVPGAKEDDYTVDEELNKVIVEESSRESNSPGGKRAEEAGEESVKNTIGSISFVSCATGEQSMQDQQEEGRRAASPPRMIFYFAFYLFIFIFISSPRYLAPLKGGSSNVHEDRVRQSRVQSRSVQ